MVSRPSPPSMALLARHIVRQLSMAPQDVREYFFALTTEVVEHYRLVSVRVASHSLTMVC